MADRETFLEQVLAVEPIDENFNPNSVPADGFEYLQQVHYEAKMCDKVVTANIDVKEFEKKRTPAYKDHPEDVKRKEFLPSPECQNEWLADFSEVRLAVERRRIVQPHHKSRKFTFPIKDHEEGWYRFCVGDYQPSEGVTKEKEVSLENDETSKMDDEQDDSLQPCEPYLHLLAAMSQVIIIAVLDYHVDWLENKKTDFKCSGKWLYALLACLEIPLIPETCSSIRSLARLAAECRSKLISPDDELLNTLNLMICLVGKYFRQLDLADA